MDSPLNHLMMQCIGLALSHLTSSLMVVLKNLGHWLGLLTLARDIPVFAEIADTVFAEALRTYCLLFLL